MAKRAVIFAGGQGTRLRPMTLAFTKHLQAVYDKPMIYHPLSVLLELNIQEIILIVHPTDLEPYQKLLGNGERFGVELKYVIQKKLQSFSENILLVKSIVADDSVCVIFADNFFHGRFEMENLSVATGASVITYEVTNPTRYGVLVTDIEGKPVKIEEKPKVPQTNLAVTGLYFFDNQLCLMAAENKQFSVTEINNLYLQQNKLSVTKFLGQWYDLGTADSLFQASNYTQRMQMDGQLIGSPEWIAWRKEFIDNKTLEKTLKLFKDSAYGKKLLEFYQGQ